MKLTAEQESVLQGESGRALALAVKTIVEYRGPDLFDAIGTEDRVSADGSTGEILLNT